MYRQKQVSLVVLVILVILALSINTQAKPPFCPHINTWGAQVESWAAGAPWIKVLSALDAQRAKNLGAKVFYRPYDIPNHDDGGTGDGTGMAVAVLARLSTIPVDKWPDAIGFRNEFGGSDTTTPQQFINYYDRLRAGGYQGWIVFGSYSTGVPESYRWSQSDVKNAVLKADAIETHEYFDRTEAFCHTWLACRHVRFINENPYLLGKPWFIGEGGSDEIFGGCHEDPYNRKGWRDGGANGQKLTEAQYINELSIWRDRCADQVLAVFIFQQGDTTNWWGFEVLGTSVATWMKSTWNTSSGAISGTVKSTTGAALADATVAITGGANTTTDSSGSFTLYNVAAGTYSLTASKSGYLPQTWTGVSVTTGNTTTVNFSITSDMGVISGTVKDEGGSAISGAAVSTTTGGHTATTNASGYYSLSNVPSGTYSVQASKTGFDTRVISGVTVTSGQTTACNFTLSCSPPVVTAHPQSQARAVYQSAVFSVAASGSSPFSYQWRRDGVNITGATASNYSIHSARAGDAGLYDCVVSNSCGSAVSNAAVFQINTGSLGAWDSDKEWSAADYPTTVSGTKWQLEDDPYTTENWGISYSIPGTIYDRNNRLQALVCDNNGNTSNSSKIKYRSDSGEGWTFNNAITTALKLGIYCIDSAGAYPSLYIRLANAGVQIKYDDSQQAWVPASGAVLGSGSPSKLSVPLRTWHYIRFQLDPSGNWQAWLNENPAQRMWGIATGGGGSYVQFGCLGGTPDNCEFAVDYVAWGQGSSIPAFGVGTLSGVVKDANNNPVSGATVSVAGSGYVTNTSANGGYSIPGVASGVYSVKASKPGYMSQTLSGIAVVMSSTSNASFNLRRAEAVGSIGSAKEYPDGTAVQLTGKVVTSSTGSAFWIEEQDRSSGIKVIAANELSIGESVDVTGILKTVNGERILEPAEYSTNKQ